MTIRLKILALHLSCCVALSSLTFAQEQGAVEAIEPSATPRSQIVESAEPIDPASLTDPGDLGAEDIDPGDLLGPVNPRNEISRAEDQWQVEPLSTRAMEGVQRTELSFKNEPLDVEMLSSDRGHAIKVTRWQASGVAIFPTYFDDVDAEIYGYTHCLQPLRSGLKFYSDFLRLPWDMVHECPCHKTYVLGYERPGNCTRSVREACLY